MQAMRICGLCGLAMVAALIGAAPATAAVKIEVLPFCPFVNSYIQKHPEYLDLVPESRREAFGL